MENISKGLLQLIQAGEGEGKRGSFHSCLRHATRYLIFAPGTFRSTVYSAPVTFLPFESFAPENTTN